MSDEALADYNARLAGWRQHVETAHAVNPELSSLREQRVAAEDRARKAAHAANKAERSPHPQIRAQAQSEFASAQNHLADTTRRHALAVEAHVGPKPVHPHDLARAGGASAGGGAKPPAQPKVLQKGKKGGSFYTTASGAKVYPGRGKKK